MTAMMSVKEGVHMSKLDLEEHHGAEEVDVEALLRKIESLEAELGRKIVGKAPGDPSVSGGQNHTSKPDQGSDGSTRLSRLTEYRNKQGDVSSVLQA